VEEEDGLKAGKYEVPEDLRYTKDHEWLKVTGVDEALVGITHYAADMLHDIVFVTLPAVGARLEMGKAAATVESVKSVSDVFSPASGEVVAVNGELAQHPELINQDPYGKGWFFKIKASSLASDRATMMDPASYAALVERLLASEG
jgi:glycine cleavage system H protein